MHKPFGYSRIIKTKQEMNNNWVYTQSGDFFKKQAEKNLKKIKEGRKNKKFELVKISDTPVTYKEIEIKS